MKWWCSAQAIPWSWAWRPYPGVWIFVGLLAIAAWRIRRAADRGDAEPLSDGAPPRLAWLVLGVLGVWVSLDWPLAPLGAGYLATAHMAQLILLTLVAPPLLLKGVPASAYRALRERPRRHAALRLLTHPLTALFLFNAIVIGTHVPQVLDTLASSQLGMMVMDLGWLGGGILFWWPVIAPVPERPWFGNGFRIGYLILNTVPVTVPYAFLVFAGHPLYSIYELAPPFRGIPTLEDQRIAGLMMKIGGGLILWCWITVYFFRWFGSDEEEARSLPGKPARSRLPGA